MTAFVKRAADLVRLNARVLGLAASGKWVRPADVAASYDRAAGTYDEAWLVHLARTTRRVVEMAPEQLPPGGLVDLGCGTGFGAELLAGRYPGRDLDACDISAGMLAQASRRGIEGVRRHEADMIAFLRTLPEGSTACVLSAWSIGYTDWRAALTECGRALARGGAMAFVVNLADTLPTVRSAFRETMRECPGSVMLACRPTFPGDIAAIRAAIEGARLRTTYSEDGWAEIPRPDDPDADLVDRILSTGILAGFDAMLPLDRPGPARDAFERRLRADTRPIRHHYFAAVALKA
ncbi:MAG: methyltransferase domain-containing protein [Armatimonadetes bacterium]|nr:methyltransferase domain-containing protein [Armatimonadota bacterium]